MTQAAGVPSERALHDLPSQRLCTMVYRSADLRGEPLDPGNSKCGGRAHSPGAALPLYTATRAADALELPMRGIAGDLVVQRLLVQLRVDLSVIDLVDPRALAVCGLPPSALVGENRRAMRLAMAVADQREDVQGVLARCTDKAGSSEGSVVILALLPRCLHKPHVEIVWERAVVFGPTTGPTPEKARS